VVYEVVPGAYLGTGADDAPEVRVLTRRAGNSTDLSISYHSFSEGKPDLFTTITFPNVVEYRWVDGDWDRIWPHPEDHEFTLIEIFNSELIERMIQSSPYRNDPTGERLGGALRESDVHHYRISFDNHGIYDVISTQCAIESVP